MRIAMTHVDLPNESKGGVAHQVHYLANTLVERGHDVTMFTFSPADAECRYQVHQYRRQASLRHVQSFVFAAHLAKTDFSGFDVLHTNGDNYLIRSCTPHLRTFHGSAKDEAGSAIRLRRRLYQAVIAQLETLGARAADLNVGVSEATRVRISAVTQIVPCGVNITHFHPGQKNERPAVLFVGTTGGRKRGQFLADIFQREVRSRFPDAELWAVAERPMEGESIVNFGRADSETLADLYRRAWVFCLPSTYEGFGVPYIEAMASGTPVVASLNAGACEVLRNGKYGFLVEDKQIGITINNLLEDAQLRQNRIDSGLLRSQEFSWERVAEQYEQLYRSLSA